MRILHVFDTILPSSGGPIELVVRLSEELGQRGFDTEIVTLDRPDDGKMMPSTLATHVLGSADLGLWGWLGRSYKYSPELVPWLCQRADKFDWVIAHGVWSYNTLGVAHALNITGTPYIIFVHGMLDPWFRQQYPLKHVKKQIYWSLALGRAMEKAKRVLFTADEELRRAAGVFVGYNNYNAQVVNIGTAGPPHDTERQAAAFRNVAPALVGKPFLLFLGRIHPKKGCDLLIKAFATIAVNFPDLQLAIAGPDSIGWRSDLNSLAATLGVSARVHWLGMLRGDSKWGVMRAANAFVLPSHQENFGIAVAEALACGTPVLISDRVNIWREIQAAGAGLVSSADLHGTAEVISAFLALTDTKRLAMRAAARAAFERNFDVRRAASSMEALLRTH